MTSSTTRPSRRHGFLTRLALVGVASGGALAFAVPTATAAPTPVPGGAVCDPAVGEGCLSVVVNGGTFDNNGFTLPIKDGDLVIAGTLAPDGPIVPRNDGHFGVYSKPMQVPGGVLGVDLPLNNLFGLTGVTSQVEATETPTINGLVTDFDLTMPARLKIDNPLLGDNCYIGSPENPVVFELNKGPEMPEGHFEDPYPAGTAWLTNIHNEAADFALPGATGCGPFGVLNPIVNWRAKVPNDSGTSLNTEATGFLFPSANGGTDPLTETGGAGGSSGS
ncbi:hypothetical protein GCM10023094_29290 [Rhodococcus olei]|uniref:Secreted protein n=1 Tax=Rhodococcus olei TaxID=2161675 RepID=A0ABP8P6I7_9NOCA